ncbi:PAS and ANTAR domain-containing protein [Nocardia brasiliensis]|uniref:PAS and ANTAR domain-containing protein n=1 Tax=Nocardia brasiliensis TaxID=37326 RepID=UPI0018939588|nr:PAS and ANTAR domain-containing protein [Nocardia brasiliensis]MBF6542394.1 PAS and ANTAR domain-containing protein [Nocardia brasiliensis]
MPQTPAEGYRILGTEPVAAGPGPSTGSFRFWFATQRWEWSPQVYRMHGYTPGEIEPTTELLLAHKHPDDRDHVAAAISRSLEHGEPFSSRHRFIDADGGEHEVMVVADHIRDDHGATVGTAGFYIDLSTTLAENHRETVDNKLPEMLQARAVIEQAKGVLMRMYRINAQQAFNVLVWRSQETNVKLRDLAEQLLTEMPTLPPAPAPIVAVFDHMLLTLHERIPHRDHQQSSN